MSHIEMEPTSHIGQTIQSFSTGVTKHLVHKIKSSKFLGISQITGMTLFVKKFDENVKYKDQMLGMGISALRTFILDSFQRPNFNTMKFDDLTVKIVNIDDIIVYYVYEGDEDTQEAIFTQFIERLVSLECFQKYKDPVYSVYKKDEKEIALIVEEIFIN